VRMRRAWLWLLLPSLVWMAAPALAGAAPDTAERPDHNESAREHADQEPPVLEAPPLPEDMTLDDVLERAAEPPPENFPDPVPDDDLRAFVLLDQAEYRIQDGGRDELGWEGYGWVGTDYDRLWVKSEGESVFDGPDRGESENDFLYSRLVTPFWSVQIGVQYANSWRPGRYRDRWSGALALQGLTPGTVELDLSLYLSEKADFTAEIEGEYNLRITQRLVLQPRVELDFAAQDVPERDLESGMTEANLDLRLRYEILRELAPYLGLRGRLLVGDTRDRAQARGEDADELFFLVGMRLTY